MEPGIICFAGLMAKSPLQILTSGLNNSMVIVYR